MRKLATVLILLLALLPIQAFGASSPQATPPSDWQTVLDEKDSRIAELEAQLSALQAQIDTLTATPAPTTAPTPEPYTLLKKGSKGGGVTALQDRLKELGYLGGKSDGSFGSGTASAVKEFQKVAGISETGEADSATQELLYRESAPASPNPIVDDSAYEALDYKANSRDPEAYTGTKVKFSGTIVQVMEDEGYAVFRVATKSGYDNVVYCLYAIPENYKRFLDDDKVTVYGVSTGIYTYETVMGGTVTIPSCMIERIELK